MKTRLLLIATLFFCISCNKEVKSIERGSFNYTLKINGITAGSAKITRTKSEGKHITETVMSLKAGNIENSSYQRVTESKDYTPISLEIKNIMKDSNSGNVQEITKKALFNEDRVTLNSNGYKTDINIKGKFYLDGAYFEDELIKKKLKPGTTIKAKIYEPSVAVDRTILVIFKVIGEKNIKVNGVDTDVIHITQKIEMLKSIDWYISRDGVTQKAVIKMLNNIFELELKK